MDYKLYDEIYGLIQLGTEGEYWDFKKEWHTNKADLLHDIICMTNNLANRDGYIIIGVSDSQSQSGIQITDVSVDANRKSQQQLITFLRDKKYPKEWVGDFKNDDMVVYHSIYPEFQIRISDKDENDNNFGDNNSIIQNLVAHNPNESHSVSKIDITNHSTVLFSEYVVFLDGYRYVIPVPSSDTVYITGHRELEKSLTYLYFDTSTVRGKLYQCLLSNWYLSDSYEYSKESYIVFKDEFERNNFNVFVYNELPEVLLKYPNLLKGKGYHENSQNDLEYFHYGWSKGNEIKAKYLADKFFGENKNLCDYISEK